MENANHIGLRASWITVLANLFLSILKFIAGVFGHSMAMIGDSIHSVSDVLSTLIVIVGLKFSSKEADKEHPYGHERIESIASFFLAIFLASTGCYIGYQGISSLFSNHFTTPTVLALSAAIISIISKEIMFWYTRGVAIKIKSNALMADAWHHRSDALSSIGSMIGIIGSMLGFMWCDSVASFIICLIILKVAFDIGKEAIRELLDTSCSQDIEFSIRLLILSVDGVIDIDSLKTRVFGNRFYVEAEIVVDGNLKLKKAHRIAHEVHDLVEETFPEVKHCMIHINPDKE